MATCIYENLVAPMQFGDDFAMHFLFFFITDKLSK